MAAGATVQAPSAFIIQDYSFTNCHKPILDLEKMEKKFLSEFGCASLRVRFFNPCVKGG
jgi:hypothetical protein